MALTLFYPSPIASYFCSSFHAINNRIPILFHLINKNKTYVSLTNGYNSIPGIIGGALGFIIPIPFPISGLLVSHTFPSSNEIVLLSDKKSPSFQIIFIWKRGLINYTCIELTIISINNDLF